MTSIKVNTVNHFHHTYAAVMLKSQPKQQPKRSFVCISLCTDCRITTLVSEIVSTPEAAPKSWPFKEKTPPVRNVFESIADASRVVQRGVGRIGRWWRRRRRRMNSITCVRRWRWRSILCHLKPWIVQLWESHVLVNEGIFFSTFL